MCSPRDTARLFRAASGLPLTWKEPLAHQEHGCLFFFNNWSLYSHTNTNQQHTTWMSLRNTMLNGRNQIGKSAFTCSKWKPKKICFGSRVWSCSTPSGCWSHGIFIWGKASALHINKLWNILCVWATFTKTRTKAAICRVAQTEEFNYRIFRTPEHEDIKP